MGYRIAINGYGRIGRSLLRAVLERADCQALSIVAINEPADPEAIALLTRYDSNHGRLGRSVTLKPGQLVIDHHVIQLLPGLAPEELPWRELDIDLVLECSGCPADRAVAQTHLDAGARRVLFSQPATPDIDLTVVRGFNDSDLRPTHRIVSAGSCTTNCLVPMLDILQTEFGLVHGAATTLHAVMNDQPVSDTLSGASLRHVRAALNAVIPVDTALERGIARLMPKLEGKLDCLHLRVPTTTVSAMDVTFTLAQATSTAAVRSAFMDASEGRWRGLFGTCSDPVSSIDFAGDARSGVIDLTQIRVVDDQLVKLIAWFDNEWGYANRMVDIALQLKALAGQRPRRVRNPLH